MTTVYGVIEPVGFLSGDHVFSHAELGVVVEISAYGELPEPHRRVYERVGQEYPILQETTSLAVIRACLAARTCQACSCRYHNDGPRPLPRSINLWPRELPATPVTNYKSAHKPARETGAYNLVQWT